MTRIVLATIAIGLVAPVAAANAASSKKHHHHDRHQAVGPVYREYDPSPASVGPRRHGPPWAMPNECFNDEGYGRWSPCGGRFD
jgi:hypothetical protein